MTLVSKMYPNGIQFKNRSSVCSVALIRLGFCAFSSTSVQSVKISWNSEHMDCLSALVFACVIDSAEKSNTSSDKRRRMIMLFSQSEREVREDETISGMNSGQSLGQDCLRICLVSAIITPTRCR
jgi:hypothetical protein